MKQTQTIGLYKKTVPPISQSRWIFFYFSLHGSIESVELILFFKSNYFVLFSLKSFKLVVFKKFLSFILSGNFFFLS